MAEQLRKRWNCLTKAHEKAWAGQQPPFMPERVKAMVRCIITEAYTDWPAPDSDTEDDDEDTDASADIESSVEDEEEAPKKKAKRSRRTLKPKTRFT